MLRSICGNRTAQTVPGRPGTEASAHHGVRPHGFSAEEMLAEMSAAGVQRAVIVPPSAPHAGDQDDLQPNALCRLAGRRLAQSLLCGRGVSDPYQEALDFLSAEDKEWITGKALAEALHWPEEGWAPG